MVPSSGEAQRIHVCSVSGRRCRCNSGEDGCKCRVDKVSDLVIPEDEVVDNIFHEGNDR